MNIDQAFPSQYVAASDLKGQDVPVVIRGIQLEDVGAKKDRKPVLYFANMSKGLVLNKTNAKIIASQYGVETDAWIGKQIVLYPSETTFQGDLVPCIRVRRVTAGALAFQQAPHPDNAAVAPTVANRLPQQGPEVTTQVAPPAQPAPQGNGMVIQF